MSNCPFSGGVNEWELGTRTPVIANESRAARAVDFGVRLLYW